MQQRAPTHAYSSSWWAGMIRTKQSTWLDDDLQDMEEKVKSIMNLIEQDADSFSKKAELYFRKRPELSNNVEEMYKSYKALADRYDRLSGELHKANYTIAAAFPDHVELAMQDEDYSFAKGITSIDPSKFYAPIENPIFSMTSKIEDNISAPKKRQVRRLSSQPCKEKDQEEMDKLQKEILTLRTEEEFAKSSYESTLKRYLDIRRQITEKQEEVCSLQDASSTQFAEVCYSLDNLSQNFQSPEHHGNVDVVVPLHDGETIVCNEVSMEEPQLEESDDNSKLHNLPSKKSEGRQVVVLAEYASMLHNYKDTREKLSEIEKKNKEYHLETMAQVEELKNANALKDEEIQLLKEMLDSLQTRFAGNVSNDIEKSNYQVAEASAKINENFHDAGGEAKLCHAKEMHTCPLEDKFRKQIDISLEENLDFWFQFSESYDQIEEFQTKYTELTSDVEKLNEIRNQKVNPITAEGAEGKSITVAKRLRELNSQLQVWMENNAMLNGELKRRLSSLCGIQDEISRAAKSSESKGVHFTKNQAAKFQGEVLCMQIENNKVAKELQAALEHVRGLQVDVAKTMAKLNESFKLSGSRNHQHRNYFTNLSSKTSIPLRTFLFGSKPKKKPSIFACVNPALQKQYSDLSSAFPR